MNVVLPETVMVLGGQLATWLSGVMDGLHVAGAAMTHTSAAVGVQGLVVTTGTPYGPVGHVVVFCAVCGNVLLPDTVSKPTGQVPVCASGTTDGTQLGGGVPPPPEVGSGMLTVEGEVFGCTAP